MNPENIIKRVFIGKNGTLYKESKVTNKRPIAERNISDVVDGKIPCYISSGDLNFDICSALYRNWGKFGPFGDVVEIMGLNINGIMMYYLTSINNLAHYRPGMSADAVIFFYNDKNYIFAGIKRKNDPGKGLAAIVGGFIDVSGYKIETPMETALREIREEIGLEVEKLPLSPGLPFPESEDVVVYKHDITGRCINLGMFLTSHEEEVLSQGLKRVYQTNAFLLMLNFPGELTKEVLLSILNANDDAEEIVLADKNEEIIFGITHHQEIFKVAKSRFINK